MLWSVWADGAAAEMSASSESYAEVRIIAGARLCICGAEFEVGPERRGNYRSSPVCNACLDRKRSSVAQRKRAATAAAKEWHNKGLTQREAARAAGVSYYLFCRAAIEAGLAEWKVERRPRAMRLFRLEQIRNLHGLGLTRKEAAQCVGVSYATFGVYVQQIGLLNWAQTPEAMAFAAKRRKAQEISTNLTKDFSDFEKDFYRLLRKKKYPIAEAAEMVRNTRTHCPVPVGS